MIKQWIDPEYRQIFPGKCILSDLASIKGEIFRKGSNRVTLRFKKGGQRFFLKRHTGVGWGEVFKELLQGRLPVLGAYNEWLAIERLQILNVSTLDPVAFAQQGWNPASRKSALVTRELRDTTSLEDVVKTWQERDDFVRLKRLLVRAVAETARRMHGNGLNHRDFYICHLHVSNTWLYEVSDNPELFVIDLHRAQIRTSVPYRWLVKDIGSLYYSAMGSGLTRNDLFRFICQYSGRPLREELNDNRHFWEDVRQRAWQLTQRQPGGDMVSVNA